jgi:peptide/nickel transport system substrate-binding protein
MQTQLAANHGIKRKFSRREFIQYGLAAGMTLAAAEGLWSESVRAEQTRGGHLGMALAGGSTTDNRASLGQY